MKPSKQSLIAVSVMTLFILIVSIACSITPAKADQTDVNIACNRYACITMDKQFIDGMEYRIFSSTDTKGMAPHVINLTKDKLEVELLNKQLKQ